MPLLSDEQIEKARSVDLLSYLQTHEPFSIRKSAANEYCLKEHDSFKMSNNKWFWFSRDFGGRGALDFLVKVRGVDFVDAVKSLTDGTFTTINQSGRAPPKIAPPQKPPKSFMLPPANVNNDRVVAYLRGRGIGKNIINSCIDNKTLYESADFHRCVFVGKDGDVPKFACQRGVLDDYKKDVYGSDKRFSFNLPPKTANSHNLAIFESATDALSHFCIYEMGNVKWDGHRLSLDGVGLLGLLSFLERHSEIQNLYLGLDNDKAGIDATNRIIKELLSDKWFSHIQMTIARPPHKDFNDTLQMIQKLNTEKTKENRQIAPPR